MSPFVILTVALVTSSGCSRADRKPSGDRAQHPDAIAGASRSVKDQATAAPAPESSTVEAKEEPPERVVRPKRDPDEKTLSDVGPAGPSAAHPTGVVMVTRDDQVRVAALHLKNSVFLLD